MADTVRRAKAGDPWAYAEMTLPIYAHRRLMGDDHLTALCAAESIVDDFLGEQPDLETWE